MFAKSRVHEFPVASRKRIGEAGLCLYLGVQLRQRGLGDRYLRFRRCDGRGMIFQSRRDDRAERPIETALDFIENGRGASVRSLGDFALRPVRLCDLIEQLVAALLERGEFIADALAPREIMRQPSALGRQSARRRCYG